MIGFNRQDQADNLRFTALKDIVEEYLGDEGSDSAVLIEDIRRACAEIRSYHDDRSKHLSAVEATLDV